MKRKFLTLIVIAFFIGMTASTCEDDLKTMGREASADFCNCYKSHSKDYCLEELKDDYSFSQYTSSVFINAFNDTNTCGAILELIKTSTKATSNGKEIIEQLLIIKK
jgi:hypothetical protein